MQFQKWTVIIFVQRNNWYKWWIFWNSFHVNILYSVERLQEIIFNTKLHSNISAICTIVNHCIPLQPPVLLYKNWLLGGGGSKIHVFSYFDFEGRIADLIVSVPNHCLSFYFVNVMELTEAYCVVLPKSILKYIIKLMFCKTNTFLHTLSQNTDLTKKLPLAEKKKKRFLIDVKLKYL